MTYRILVTGSREWTDRDTVWKVLGGIATGANVPLQELTIVHGANPHGADRIAAQWAQAHGVQQEQHPADWKRYGRAAGPIRNQEMINSGIDICLAFPLPQSTGTRDMIKRAVDAGITVIDCSDQQP